MRAAASTNTTVVVAGIQVVATWAVDGILGVVGMKVSIMAGMAAGVAAGTIHAGKMANGFVIKGSF